MPAAITKPHGSTRMVSKQLGATADGDWDGGDFSRLAIAVVKLPTGPGPGSCQDTSQLIEPLNNWVSQERIFTRAPPRCIVRSFDLSYMTSTI